jgi:predicted enzyme related to lactoylglutathione lyase
MPMPEMEGQSPIPAHWLDYFGTADIDASVAKARALGGSVFVEPMTVGSMVSFAVLADPAGATFALMQPLGAM